ncbi:MAG: glycosyltransferase family 4 protein [Actinoplanes sp.]
MSSPLWAVLPGGIDDPAAPSGGNLYDRIVLDALAADRDVHEIAVPGAWPTPAAAARGALTRAISEIPDNSVVLLDGLVACGVPEILEPHAGRLRLAILVHLPLSDETGLAPADAADLRGRERRALHCASVVVATSEAAARRLTEMHDLSGVEIAEPGVAPAPPARPDPTGRRLLNVASVTPRKGQDLLVAALEQHLAGLDWRCTVVGALIRPVPHADPRIHFTGPRTGEALNESYADADLFVLPSRAETYGMVVTEALARGLPVIAAEVGGVPEALGAAPDGTLPGALIPPDDPAALAEALRAWLTDAGLRDRWRAAALARRETLPRWTKTARQLAGYLDDLGEHR